MTVLAAKINRYRGCWVTPKLPAEPAVFSQRLYYSLQVWQQQGIKVVWLTIPSYLSSLIAIAVKQGFDFHHVSHTDGKSLVLTRRLQTDAVIPEFANHRIGVGGIVFNNSGQVLTVVEKHDMQRRPGHFKFPGGAVDRHEMLRDAVVREVYEETGIRGKFNGIVGFRHYHKGQFGTSDFYFLCHLTALSTAIAPCPEEIGIAQWMHVDDYLTTESVIGFNKAMLKAALSKQYLTTTEVEMIVSISPEEYEVFL